MNSNPPLNIVETKLKLNKPTKPQLIPPMITNNKIIFFKIITPFSRYFAQNGGIIPGLWIVKKWLGCQKLQNFWQNSHFFVQKQQEKEFFGGQKQKIQKRRERREWCIGKGPWNPWKHWVLPFEKPQKKLKKI